jgi:hypothetical protein
MIQIRLTFGARSIGVDLCGRADVYEASRCFRETGNLQDCAERRSGGKYLEGYLRDTFHKLSVSKSYSGISKSVTISSSSFYDIRGLQDNTERRFGAL